MRLTLTALRSTRTAGAAASLAVALTLSACGGGDDPTISAEPGSQGGSAPSSVAGIDAENNEADVTFIQDMKPHHEGAIDMAELAATRATNPEVKALATKIVAAQDPEIELMTKMATAWGVDLEAGGSMGSMPGMDMGGEADVAALEPLSGAAFDREFLTRMIAHHEGAIEMANAVLAQGQNPQVKQLANDIVAGQTAEIAQMKELLTKV